MERITSRIRTAISAGDWTVANHLMDELRSEVEKAWTTTKTDSERQSLEQEVLDMLEWARTTVMASRAQDVDQLAGVTRRRGYTRMEGEPAGVTFDA